MRTFPVKFSAGQLELSAIVTASSHNHKFKVEMVTGEPDPIVLFRSEQKGWSILHNGTRNIPMSAYTELENEIDTYLNTKKLPVKRVKKLL